MHSVLSKFYRLRVVKRPGTCRTVTGDWRDWGLTTGGWRDLRCRRGPRCTYLWWNFRTPQSCGWYRIGPYYSYGRRRCVPGSRIPACRVSKNKTRPGDVDFWYFLPCGGVRTTASYYPLLSVLEIFLFGFWCGLPVT